MWLFKSKSFWFFFIVIVVLIGGFAIFLAAQGGSVSGSGLAGIVVSLVIVLGILIVYVWLASLVGSAAGRKGRSESVWFLIAFLFGIILPAIIVAIMAPAANPNAVLGDPDDYTDCPFCGEEILAVAKKCKHCGEFLEATA